jgi:hypothetical protein
MKTQRIGRKRQFAKACLASLLAAFFTLSMLVPMAEAQQRIEQRRSLLEMLFGRPLSQPEYTPEAPPPRRIPRARAKRSTPAPPPKTIVAQPDQPAPAEKLDTAKKVLVVGDFLASGLGEGLADAFAASPGVMIEAHGNVASGLVRQDYYDWQKQLPEMLDEAKPAVVVVMIGANDRQQMVGNQLNEKYGTDVWFMGYEARILAFAKIVTSRNIPLLWVGLPSFVSPSMTADSVKLNQLYQSQVTSAGGEFVDIWDGFADENGKFIVTGSDINGQQVRLRTADGINLTTSGRRKVAFYVEKPARRLLGDQASPDIIRLDTDKAGGVANLPPSETNQPQKTQPISLSDPDLDGGAELLGAKAVAPVSTSSPRDLLVEKGQMAPAPTGRVDDYRLPDTKAAH